MESKDTGDTGDAGDAGTAAKAWHKKELPQDAVRQLSQDLGIEALHSSIFARRGCTAPEELLYFVEKKSRYLHNPFLLSEMAEAVERVLLALEEQEQVLIFGDRDVDGVCATAILYHGLLQLGADEGQLGYRNPSAGEAYGLSPAVVQEAAERGVTLLLTADCGCANHTEIALAAELGLDVVVLDHHLPKEQRPSAYALVNPHSPDEVGRHYPFAAICAASVCGKFLWALAYAKELGGGTEHTAPSSPSSDGLCGLIPGFCLLDIVVPQAGAAGGAGIYVRAARLRNLCVHSRLELRLQGREDAERLLAYLQHEVLCSFTPGATRAALKEIYGPSSDIYLFDLTDALLRQLPRLGGRLRQSGGLRDAPTLRRELQRLSHLARYRGLDFFDSQVELAISLLGQQLILPQQVLEQSIDLMAIASIGDMMPLRDENRIIVQLGLARLDDSPRSGLRELLLEMGLLGQPLSARELSWKVIPVLNSAGRMGHTELVTALLTAPDASKRRSLAQQLLQLNQKRREQSEKFLSLAQQPARQSYAESQQQLVYVAIAELSRGITGLLAGRLSQQYGGVPCVVLAQETSEAEQGHWSGSLRSSGDPSVLSLLEPLGDWFGNYGGHRAAGGFSISAQKQAELWPALLSLLPLPRAHQDSEQPPRYEIDAEIPLALLSPGLCLKLWRALAPYGMEWPELLLLSKGLLLEDVQAIGQSEAGHLRLALRNPQAAEQGKSLTAVFWRAAERYGRDFTKGDTVDILYRIQANYYQGQLRFQLEIVDIRRP